MDISIDEVATLLGLKEIELYKVKRELFYSREQTAKLEQECADAGLRENNDGDDAAAPETDTPA